MLNVTDYDYCERIFSPIHRDRAKKRKESKVIYRHTNTHSYFETDAQRKIHTHRAHGGARARKIKRKMCSIRTFPLRYSPRVFVLCIFFKTHSPRLKDEMCWMCVCIAGANIVLLPPPSNVFQIQLDTLHIRTKEPKTHQF